MLYLLFKLAQQIQRIYSVCGRLCIRNFLAVKLNLFRVVFASATCLAFSAGAQTAYWNGPNTSPVGSPAGGTGNWNSTRLNWTNSSGSSSFAWPTGSIAIFSGSSGTATLQEVLSVGGFEFQTSGYLLSSDDYVNHYLNLSKDANLITPSGGTATIELRIFGSYGLTFSGGTAILTRGNGYTGPTYISSGKLQLGNGGGTGNLDFTSSITVDSGAIFSFYHNNDTENYAMPIKGQGEVRNEGNSNITLSGQNLYTGPTNVLAGTFTAGSSNGAFGVNSAVNIAGSATLALNGYNAAIGSLTGTGSVTGPGTFTVGGDGTSKVFGGVIGGATAVVKTGAGTQTLSGSNTYTGATTISAGALLAAIFLHSAWSITRQALEEVRGVRRGEPSGRWA